MVNFKISILKLPQLSNYRSSGLVQLANNGKFTVLFCIPIVSNPLLPIIWKFIFKVFKSKEEAQINSVYDKIKSNIEIGLKDFETIGPVGYEDINSQVLFKAFEFPVGEPRIIKEGSDVYIIMVISRDKVTVEPIEKIRPRIEKSIIAIKEQQLLDDWLKIKREKAKINILKQ